MWQQIRKNPFLQSSLITTVAFNGANFLSFVVNFLLVRAISVPDYGEYVAATAYAGLLSIPFSILTLIIIKKIGQHKAQERTEYILRLERRLGKFMRRNGWWMAMVGLGLGWGINYFANLSHAMSIGYILFSLLLSAWGMFWAASLQGLKDFRGFSIATMGTMVVRIMLLVAAIFVFPHSLVFIYLTILGSSLAGIMWQRWRVKKQGSEKRRRAGMDKEIRLKMTKEAWVTTLGTLGMTALISVDVMLVKKFQTESVAGLFGLLSLGAKIIFYATQPIMQVAFAFGAAKEGEKYQLKNLKISTLILLVVGGGVIGAYLIAPELIIRILAGEKYLAITGYLWMAGVFGLLFILNNLYTQFLINRKSFWAGGALAMVGMQSLLIWQWHDSLRQILLIDIGVGIGLLLVNLMGIYLTARPAYGKKSTNSVV
ncbi:hypothetical protein FWH30_02010 [Microgenomates group bacterium]|nr:hypothetical protein [Microgenomates group bacterium]